MSVATENPYCIHDESCDDCEPPKDLSDCYFCGRDTDTWIEDHDPSTGYRGRLYYCEQCEDKIY